MDAFWSSSSPPSPPPPPPPSWSDLPDHLLELLAGASTSFLCLARFGAVCQSWRRAAAAVAASIPSFPYLTFLSFGLMGPTRSFYGLSDHKLSHRKEVPGESHHFVHWGSSNGWLTKADLHNQPFLLDPISGARLDLPRLLTPDVGAKKSYSQHRVKLVLSNSPMDPTCVVLVVVCTEERRFAYARPGDRSWTPLPITCWGFVDAAYHDGRFWVLSSFNCVFSIDTVNFTTKYFFPHDLDVVTLMSRGNMFRSHSYLVALPSRGIALVYRSKDFDEDDCVRTTGFHIYLLEQRGERKEWVELDSIGDDCSLLLGEEHSMSFPAASGVRGACMANCIYFTEYRRDWSLDLRVFHAKEKTFSNCARIHPPTRNPVWFCTRQEVLGI